MRYSACYDGLQWFGLLTTGSSKPQTKNMHNLPVTQKMVYMLSAVARRMFKPRAHFIQLIWILCKWVCEQTLKKVYVLNSNHSYDLSTTLFNFCWCIWPVWQAIFHYSVTSCHVQIVLCEIQYKQQVFMYSNHMKSETQRKVKLEVLLLDGRYWNAECLLGGGIGGVLEHTPWKSIKAGLEALSVLCCHRTYNMWMHEACVRNV